MEWKYLNQWTHNRILPQTGVDTILAFEDQYLICFKNSREILQINLNQKDCFLFLTDEMKLPFVPEGKMGNISQMLSSARTERIEMELHDRIIKIWFKKRDIYNDTTTYVLVLELIPRFQNIILCKEEDNELIIVESLRKFSFAENNQRQILLNIPYVQPETTYEVEDREIVFPLQIHTEGFNWEGNDINIWFEALFYQVELQKRLQQRKKDKQKAILKNLKKVQLKLEKQQQELLNAEKETEWQQKAELLKHNLHAFKPGMTSVEVINYYSENQELVTIELLPGKKPLDNLQYYIRKYKKARSGREKIKENIISTEDELRSLQDMLEAIESVTSYADFVSSYKSEKHSRFSQEALPFRRLRINANWEIMIGRKARENDLLTGRVAKPNDWWFHTRIYQGTHVVLRNYAKLTPNDDLIEVCCRLAAYYSKAKTSINVPVDYTQIRFVTKPRGAAPGYVIYKNQKTVFVNPLDFREARSELERLGYLVPGV
jgi:predicted ribosome quality control (RQC) complex YloA/Tae2 family protein